MTLRVSDKGSAWPVAHLDGCVRGRLQPIIWSNPVRLALRVWAAFLSGCRLREGVDGTGNDQAEERERDG
jgi:hypothetical protein